MRFIHAGGDTARLWLGAPLAGYVGPPVRYARASGNPALLAVPANYVTLFQQDDQLSSRSSPAPAGDRSVSPVYLEADGRSVVLEPDSAGAWRQAATGPSDRETDRRALAEAWVVGRADSLVTSARWGALTGGAPRCPS